MTTPLCYNSKSMSLVERKKQQWAREREELSNLGVPFRQQSQSFDKPFERPRYGSRPSMVQKQLTPDNYQTTQERRGSLPPLYKNQYNSNYDYNRNEKIDRGDRGGETSGYGSDNNNNDYKEHCLPPTGNGQWNRGHQQSGYESSSSYRDDRPKWGDKGVGVGKFWQPKEEPYEKTANEPPNWVKRGLQVDGAIVVANSSPSVSPEQRCEENDRPYTGSSFSKHKTYIRGQNIPVDTVELAERERRRQLALAHQEAIRQQLEEREKKRHEERARKLQEEREEELRIQKEQDYARQRKLEEERALQEKLERERKRKEAIKEALEIAEKEAKLEKIRLRMMKQSINNNVDHNITENVVEKQKVPESSIIETKKEVRQLETKKEITHEAIEQKNHNKQLNNTREITSAHKHDNIAKEINNNLAEDAAASYSNVSPTKSTTSLANSVISNQSNQLNNENRCLTPVIQSPRNNNNFTPRTDQFAYFFQPSMDSLQNMQYAVLIPASTSQASTSQFSIAIPVSMPVQTDTSAVNTSRTENRVLTPTLYRNNTKKCDCSTQTENPFNSARSSSETGDSREKYLREKMANLELNYENKRRDHRSRSESMDERPKWGVNRPPTRYLKQSEKDPLYQRRKLRQKRENANKSYDEKNSSDESQTGSPRRYRRKDLTEKRHSRARWRTEERMFSGNVRMYQREIVPLEGDKNHLYFKCCCTCRCQKHGCSENVRVDILKIEENSPREREESPSHRNDSARGDRDNSLPDFNINNRNESSSKVDILSKLSSLHNGLLLEQEKWENSPRTPTLSPYRA